MLLDRDLSRSIEQRVALREKVYRNLRVQDFKIRANSNKKKKPGTLTVGKKKKAVRKKGW